MRNKRWWWW